MSIKPARIRAIVVAVLVLAFVIPWTYAHIAYAWPWKRFQTGTLISCDGQYSITFIGSSELSVGDRVLSGGCG